MPELRKDPIVNRWVIISTERGKRPNDFPSPPKKNKKGSCPFCLGNEEMTPAEVFALRPESSLANSPGWSVRVVPNKFPALKPAEGTVGRAEEGLFDKMDGIGAHEVVIESPDHDTELEFLSGADIENCLLAFRQRFLELKKDRRFKYILIFKNHGEAAGASLEHSHCQLIALPIVPELVSEEISGSRRHFKNTERCIYCDLIGQERKDGTRVVSENERFITLCPFASRFPFEMWVLPKTHASRFEETGQELYSDLAGLLKETLLRMRGALGGPPYNFFLHTSPLNRKHSGYYHWHIEIMPKLTRLAGFEQGTGFYINPTLPEEAAETLRNVNL